MGNNKIKTLDQDKDFMEQPSSKFAKSAVKLTQYKEEQVILKARERDGKTRKTLAAMKAFPIVC